MRFYLDSAPVIYSVEQVPVYAAVVDSRLSAQAVVRVASDLTRLECRVKPLREGNADLLQDYDDYFDQTVAEIVALSREVIDHATEIRAQYRFRTPDAIHLAAAVAGNCDVFLTNDYRLAAFPGIAVEVIQP